MNTKLLISAVLASTIAVVGCSDDNGTGGSGGTAATGGTGGSGGTPAAVNCDDLPNLDGYAVGEVFDNVPETASDDCTDPMFALGSDAAARLNTRLENADPGDVVCLEAGTYEMDGTINVSLVGGTLPPAPPKKLTIKGIGASPDDTVLKFGGPGSGIGIFVQKDDVAVENLWVKNTGANGIEQDGTSGSVFRKVNVSWDDFCGENPADNCGNPCDTDVEDDCGDLVLTCADGVCDEDAGEACRTSADCVGVDVACIGECVGDQGKNGAYGIYPTNCENTLVEYSQATDAADAGIYIGKCGWLDDETTGGIVRFNIAANSVAGLEVENCLDVIAHDNLAMGNTGGLMPLQQPISADRPANTGVLMENNKVWCNNGENFAEVGVVQIIPVGTGLLILGGQGVEVRNNDVQGNRSLAMAIVSSSFTCDAAGADCPPYSYPYNPYAEDIYAHDNFFDNNGNNFDEESDFAVLFNLLGLGTADNPVEDILWDGQIREGVDDPGICLGADFTGTYRDLSHNMCQGITPDIAYAACLAENTDNDTTGRLCDGE
jgi:parallel beta-helix repeat protein